MKEIGKQLGKFLLEALKQMDWRAVLYKVMTNTVLPMVKQRVQDSSSKIDDYVFKGVESLVNNYLKPELPAVEDAK